VPSPLTTRDGFHWTKPHARRQLRILQARLGYWPSMQEYRVLSKLDQCLPPFEEVVRLYGTWSAARSVVTDS
jgi:hypothetical protein